MANNGAGGVGGVGGARVRSLIENATNSTAGEVDPRLLKAIKSVVRYTDSEVPLVVETLMDSMKKPHSQIRYLALLVVDELFMRSKLFRSLIVANLVEFLSLSVGFRRNKQLPHPESIASRLRSKAIECLEKWNNSFGIHYPQIRVGVEYLKNVRKFQFPNRLEMVARLEQEQREREARSKAILLKKFETLVENFPSIKSEIEMTIDEVEESLEIVHEKESDFDFASCGSEDEFVMETRSVALLQLRNEALKEGERIYESVENKAVFDVVREFYKLLSTRHLPLVQEWMSVLVRVDPPDVKSRDSLLMECIDIKNRILSVEEKCKQLGCSLNASIPEEMEEDIWEDGKIDFFDAVKSVAECSQSNVVVDTENSKADTERKLKGKELHTEENESDVASHRRKLLAEAPVKKWGSYLDDWGSKRDVLANQRGLELEGHWGRVEHDAVIPAEKIAELKFQASVYSEKHEEIRPCLAPLQKGGFCQRRDLRVCPFHGPIIPRDLEGNPTNQGVEFCNKAAQDVNANQLGNEQIDFEKMTENLAREAVKNVRERDQQMVKSLKRARLAKIREHNEAVLRTAALASTSRSESICENSGTVDSDRSLAKRKKSTLASMLQKKVTSKDRIAKKLLTSRATETAIQRLRQAEQAAYRENFPNQW